MGIDVYMKWPGQTEAERQAQFTGYSIAAGDVGYLRESAGGSPSAIKVLLPEAWANDGEDTPTDPVRLRERLPAALAAVAKRYADEPEIVPLAQKAFEDFVVLAEAKAAAGVPVTVDVR